MGLAAGLQTKTLTFDQLVDQRDIKLIAEKLGPYKVPVKQP